MFRGCFHYFGHGMTLGLLLNHIIRILFTISYSTSHTWHPSSCIFTIFGYRAMNLSEIVIISFKKQYNSPTSEKSFESSTLPPSSNAWRHSSNSSEIVRIEAVANITEGVKQEESSVLTKEKVPQESSTEIPVVTCWECHKVSIYFSAFSGPVPLPIYKSTSIYANAICKVRCRNEIQNQDDWDNKMPEKCQGENNCKHNRCRHCYDIDDDFGRLTYCDRSLIETWNRC